MKSYRWISVKIPNDWVVAIDVLCRAKGISRSRWIRELIWNGLGHHYRDIISQIVRGRGQ